MAEPDRNDAPNPVGDLADSVTDLANVAESVAITPDGGVVKTIIREGSGDVPPLHARCLGAYADSRVFDDLHQIGVGWSLFTLFYATFASTICLR